MTSGEDPSVVVGMEKTVEVQTLGSGTEETVVAPVAPIIDKSKDSGAGPYTEDFKKYLSGKEPELSKQPAEPHPHWFAVKDPTGPTISGSGKYDSSSHQSSRHHKGSHGLGRRREDDVNVSSRVI